MTCWPQPARLLKATAIFSMKMLVAAAVITAIAGPALAGDVSGAADSSLKDTTVYETQRPFQIYANVALASDYAFRGFTETDEGPAIQGGFDFVWDWFYVGVWASNVDFGTSDKWHTGEANIEIDLYAGVQKTINSVSFDLMLLYYAYPNAVDPLGEFNFWEIKAGVSGYVFDSLKLGFNIYYSPDYFEETGNNWIFELTSKKYLPHFWKFDPVLFASIAYQEGDEDEGGFDYWFWKAGIALKFYDHYSFEVHYVDTMDVPFACEDLCDGRLIAALKAEF